jgi:hypothetical protein
MARAHNPTQERPPKLLRVAKTLAPSQDGAKRLAAKYGHELVCVRHRIDPISSMRYITVELVEDRLPVASLGDVEVAVRIGPMEKSLRSVMIACGAVWDRHARVWRMKRSVARTLRLLRKIVPNPSGKP